jgi:hypothetical protein
MKLININFLFIFMWASTAQSEIDMSKIFQAPRDFSLGMGASMLVDQKDGLFHGPSVGVKGDKISFKTFMEIEGLGSPGHRSFYYLFEDDKLQGVIKTISLIGLVEDEAFRISALNYKSVLDAVSGNSEKSQILRKDSEGFAKVTLEKWTIGDEMLNVFHVATNYESSVGVLYVNTNFPTEQLFISAADQRFQGQISEKGNIVDFSREDLLKVAGIQVADQQKSELKVALSNPQLNVANQMLDEENKDISSGKNSDGYAHNYLIWISITLVFLIGIYVFQNKKK